MEYGIIYIKICPPKGSPGEWIKYCHIFSSTPKSFQENVREIANNINTKHQEDIIIPMDITVHPGCTTTSESVEEIATDMYNQFLDLSERQGIPNSIRCVYSIGELRNVDVKSTHNLGNDEVMVNLGHYLDSSDDVGIFRL
jgi:hypothetical protein